MSNDVLGGVERLSAFWSADPWSPRDLRWRRRAHRFEILDPLDVAAGHGARWRQLVGMAPQPPPQQPS